MIRTSSQVPFLTRDALCSLFELPQERVRVFTARVGGGFGGKQEMYTEDLVAFAVLRTGRRVAYEMSRTDEFQRTAVRHPMRVKVALGANADGTLTAMKVDVLSDAGAYGNHSRGVLFHGCAESISLYNAPAKRVDAEAVYTNNVPSGAFRGYGLGQVILGVESAMDELALRPRNRPVRAAPHQRGPRGRPAAHDARGDRARHGLGLVRPRPVPRPRRVGPGPRQRRRRRRPARTGGSARAWRSR